MRKFMVIAMLAVSSPVLTLAGAMPPQCCWMVGPCCKPPLPLPPTVPTFTVFDNRDVMHPRF